jgi:putative lipase involved disintegration of autophagic bodies
MYQESGEKLIFKIVNSIVALMYWKICTLNMVSGKQVNQQDFQIPNTLFHICQFISSIKVLTKCKKYSEYFTDKECEINSVTSFRSQEKHLH